MSVINHGADKTETKESLGIGKWISFTAPLILGTDLEGDSRLPRQVKFCDFASAGNTWSPDSRYRVWIRKTLNVMNLEYNAY